MTLEEMMKLQKSIVEAKKQAEIIFYKLEGQYEIISNLIDTENKKDKKDK